MKKVFLSTLILLSVSTLIFLSYSYVNNQNEEEKALAEKLETVKESKNISRDKIQQSKIAIEGVFPSYSIDYLKENSDYIVQGKPIEILDSYMEQEDIPFTEFLFKINKVYKGNENKEIKVIQDGQAGYAFSDHPLMEVNQKYLLFLKKMPNEKLVILGGPVAKFDYKAEKGVYKNITGTTLDEKLNVIN